MPRPLVLPLLMLLSASLVTACAGAAEPPPPPPRPSAALGPPPTMRVLAAGFEAPWELTWGPDNFLWVTEKVGKRVDRINPADGSKTTVLTIDEVSASGAQDGLLGLAFAGPSAYLAYSYDADPGPPTSLRGKIVRYQYDRAPRAGPAHRATGGREGLEHLSTTAGHSSPGSGTASPTSTRTGPPRPTVPS